MRKLYLALAFLCASALPGFTAKHALIIGNAVYITAPDLRNPISDAAAYAETFEALGYQVTRLENLDRDGLEVAVAIFADKIQAGDDAVFVFSGHGWSDGTINYLLPTDVDSNASKRLTQLRSIALQNGVNGVFRPDQSGRSLSASRRH